MPRPTPRVTPPNHGYQYLTELRYDAPDPLLEKSRLGLRGLGTPLRSLEIEFGPSRIEVTSGTSTGMNPADLMLLFRNATRRIFAREGCLASAPAGIGMEPLFLRRPSAFPARVGGKLFFVPHVPMATFNHRSSYEWERRAPMDFGRGTDHFGKSIHWSCPTIPRGPMHHHEGRSS